MLAGSKKKKTSTMKVGYAKAPGEELQQDAGAAMALLQARPAAAASSSAGVQLSRQGSAGSSGALTDKLQKTAATAARQAQPSMPTSPSALSGRGAAAGSTPSRAEQAEASAAIAAAAAAAAGGALEPEAVRKDLQKYIRTLDGTVGIRSKALQSYSRTLLQQVTAAQQRAAASERELAAQRRQQLQESAKATEQVCGKQASEAPEHVLAVLGAWCTISAVTLLCVHGSR